MGLTSLRSALVAALAVCALAPRAKADFEGKLKITSDPPHEGRERPTEGTIRGKGTRWRWDMTGGLMGPTAMILDMKSGKGLILVEQRKMAMTFDAKANREGGPGGQRQGFDVVCESGDASDCLTKNGFKKTGTETVNGYKSDRWERDKQRGEETAHQSIWVPQGFKDFAFVRHQSKTPNHTETTDVLDLKKASVSDEIFEKPSGYQEMDMSKMHPGMRPGGTRPPFPPGMKPPEQRP